MFFMLVFHAIDTNPVWSRLSLANRLVCLVLRWSLTCRSIGGLSLSLCGGFERVFEEWDLWDQVSLDHLIHCTCHNLRGVFVYVGLVVMGGCVI